MGLLWALHIPDQVLQPAWWILGWVGAALWALWASYGVEDEEIPRIGLFSAVFFLGTLFHLPLLNVHLLLPGIMGLFLGRRVILAILIAMLLQAGMGHGGFTTAGINSLIMGVPALCAWCVFTPLIKRYQANKWVLTVFGFLLGFLPVALAVIFHSLALYQGGVVSLTPQILVTLPWHLVVAVAEGIFLASALPFLAAAGVAPFGDTPLSKQPDEPTSPPTGPLPALLALLALGWAETPLSAHPIAAVPVPLPHNLRIDWKTLPGDKLEVDAYFERGAPFQTGELVLKNAQGAEILRENRHQSGRFVIAIPSGHPGDLDLYIHADDHLAHAKIPASSRLTPAPLTPGQTETNASPTPNTEPAPIASPFQPGANLRDMLLGLSLILSACAFWMSWRSMKRQGR